MRPRILALALVVSCACQQKPSPAGGTGAAVSGAAGEAKALIDQGQLDAALAKLQQQPGDPDALYYQGVVWAKKAESAPLPTPPPAASPLPRGAEPPQAPEFKPEELTAIDFFEKAVAARPDHALAHLALADLLAPHGARRFDAEEAAKKKPVARKGKAVPEPAPVPEGPDWSPGRVLKEYQLARQADPKSAATSERLIRFAARVGQFDAAAAVFREITQGQESAEPYIRFGDFLASEKQDREGAIDEYKQALVWKADDDATRAKIAELYLAMGAEYFAAQQYAIAETRFKEAQKFVTDKNSPQGQKLQEYMDKLKAIRGR